MWPLRVTFGCLLGGLVVAVIPAPEAGLMANTLTAAVALGVAYGLGWSRRDSRAVADGQRAATEIDSLRSRLSRNPRPCPPPSIN